MPFRAKTDHDGVYWGVEEVEVLSPDDVEVPAGCDLPSGMYRWDPLASPSPTFVPLPAAERKAAPGAPTLEQAFHDYLTNGKGGPRVSAWLDWMKKSMDERGKR